MLNKARGRRAMLRRTGLAAAAGISPAAVAAGKAAAKGEAAVRPPAHAAEAERPIVWRCQMAWSLDDDFSAYLRKFSQTLDFLSGGRLQLQLLPPGSVVPAREMVDAVSEGKLDACHQTPSSQAWRRPAFGLWGNGPAFGMDGLTMLSWHYQGGGEALLAELYAAAGLSVHSILYGTMPTQALGWFKRPLARVEEMKGLRMRAAGLAGEIYREMGANVQWLAPEEILPALRRDQIDAVEFSSISSDRALGLSDLLKVCMLQSFHQCTEQIELLVNRDRYAALSPELQQVLLLTSQAVSASMNRKRVNDNSMHYIELREIQRVRFYKTPESVLRAQLAAWDRVSTRYSNADPLFARIMASMRRYAQRCVGWQNDTRVDQAMAYNHYFAQRVPKGS